jgi:cytochrome P450
MKIEQSSIAASAAGRAANRLPPGPKGNWLLGHLGELRRDILGFYTRCARDYGDVAYFRFGRKPIYLLSHPDLVEEVLVTQNQRFVKNYLLRLLTPLLGNGLLMSEGSFWLRQRRLAQPAFHKNRVAAYGAAMVAFTERMLAQWQSGEQRDIHHEMMKLTLAIAAKTLFDVDVQNEAVDVGAALDVVRRDFSARMGSIWPIPTSWPTPGNIRLRRAVRRLDRIIYRYIDERRRASHEGNDLLSLLLNARDEDDGSQMTDQQLRDEAMTIFLAGHETTAIAMSWTWYLLARHPEAEAKLVAELADVLAGRSPTVEDLPRLRYTEMVVAEALRLYPPAYVIGREAAEPAEVGGYAVPPGTTLLISQWVIHRDSRFFENPDRFHPERWADGLAQRLPKYAYFPFGGGPRVCIGNTFALQEAVLLLASIAPRFHFTLESAEPVRTQPTVTLRPKGGIPAVLAKRQ